MDSPAQRYTWLGEQKLRDYKRSSSKASTGPGTGRGASQPLCRRTLGASLVTVPVSEMRKMKLKRLRNVLKTIQ